MRTGAVVLQPLPWRDIVTRASVVVGAQYLARLIGRKAMHSSTVAPAPGSHVELHAISLLHATVLAAFGARSDGRAADPHVHTILTGSLGYFVHDWLAMIFLRGDAARLDRTMHLHHALSIFTTCKVLRTPDLWPLVGPVCLIETSSVFLNLMSILQTRRPVPAAAMRAAQLLFAATFFMTRILWLPHLTCTHLLSRSRGSSYQFRGALLSLNVMNVYWFGKIVRKMRATL